MGGNNLMCNDYISIMNMWVLWSLFSYCVLCIKDQSKYIQYLEEQRRYAALIQIWPVLYRNPFHHFLNQCWWNIWDVLLQIPKNFPLSIKFKLRMKNCGWNSFMISATANPTSHDEYEISIYFWVAWLGKMYWIISTGLTWFRDERHFICPYTTTDMFGYQNAVA